MAARPRRVKWAASRRDGSPPKRTVRTLPIFRDNRSISFMLAVHRGVVLDIDSSVSPTHGEQEMSVWNGHCGCTCYHPLFLFNQFGDLELGLHRLTRLRHPKAAQNHRRPACGRQSSRRHWRIPGKLLRSHPLIRGCADTDFMMACALGADRQAICEMSVQTLGSALANTHNIGMQLYATKLVYEGQLQAKAPPYLHFCFAS
jgi:Transposase DDE domain group 1